MGKNLFLSLCSVDWRVKTLTNNPHNTTVFMQAILKSVGLGLSLSHTHKDIAVEGG